MKMGKYLHWGLTINVSSLFDEFEEIIYIKLGRSLLKSTASYALN